MTGQIDHPSCAGAHLTGLLQSRGQYNGEPQILRKGQ